MPRRFPQGGWLITLPRKLAAGRLVVACAALLAAGLAVSREAGDPPPQRDYSGLIGDRERGFYVARLAGCITCHRSPEEGGSVFSGGVAIESRAGTYYAPNITPHPEDGIGGWSFEDFARSLTEGLDPEGKHYFPVYPYPFYTRLTSQDIVDLWAAVRSAPAAPGRAPRHRLKLFYRFLRPAVGGWKERFFQAGELAPDESRSEQWNRGRYLAEGPAHCGACHTPRGAMGGRDETRRYRGGVEKVGANGPDITTRTLEENGWTEEDLAWSLRSAIMANGDVYGGAMAEVVHHGARYWSNADLTAIAHYFLNLPSGE